MCKKEIEKLKKELEKAKKEFLKFTENYDLRNKDILRKQKHSLRVMEISKQISNELKLNEEEIQISALIGLLHDIARFEQWKIYKVYSDQFSFDHGDKGAEILEENNFIRNFIHNHAISIM